MKKINGIPKLNIKFPKKSINISFLTPRNNINRNNAFTQTNNNYLFTTFDCFSQRISSPLSYNKSSYQTYWINNKIDKKFFSTYKILNLNDLPLSERLKTSSTRYSDWTSYKDKLEQLSRRLEEEKKIKLRKNKNKYNSLIKNSKRQVNEVNFMPSPNLINTSKLSKLVQVNSIKNNKKHKSKKIKKNLEKKGNLISDKNLPIFLRERYNIKGTNIISPFCIKARDESLYKRIFYSYFKKPIITKKKSVDNKLNIIYAENEEKFKKKIQNINEKIKKEGKKEKNAVFPNSEEQKLAKIKRKIKFMKKIVDYAYPEMVLTRVREANKMLRISRNRADKLIPFKSEDNKLEQYNNIITKDLRKSIAISKL